MRKLTAPRLEVISDRWVNGRRRIVKEGEPVEFGQALVLLT